MSETKKRLSLKCKLVHTVEGEKTFDELASELAQKFADSSTSLILEVESESFNGKLKIPFKHQPDINRIILETLHTSMAADPVYQKYIEFQSIRAAYKKCKAEYEAQRAPKSRKQPARRRSLSPVRSSQSSFSSLSSSEEEPTPRPAPRRILTRGAVRKQLKPTHFIEEDIRLPSVPLVHGTEFISLKPAFKLLISDQAWLNDKDAYNTLWEENDFLRNAYELMSRIIAQSINPTFLGTWLHTWVENQITRKTWHGLELGNTHSGICDFCGHDEPICYRYVPILNEYDDNVNVFDKSCGEKFKGVSDFLTAIHRMIEDLQKGRKQYKVFWIDLTEAMHRMKQATK